MSPIGRACGAASLPKSNGNGPAADRNAHDAAAERIMAILEEATSSPMSSPSPTDLREGLLPFNDDGPPPPKKRAVGRPPNTDHFKKPIRMVAVANKRIGRKLNRPLVQGNGMPPPAVPSKINFRARALDPQRQMPVHIVKDGEKCQMGLEILYNNKALKRPLFSVPSGMEKEEEKELHLRLAIEAQKANTTGALHSERHIPIRQVEVLDVKEYNKWSNWDRFVDRSIAYRTLDRGEYDFCDEDTSYDADEEDEAWLSLEGAFITLDEFEAIIEKLEVMSRERIPDCDEVAQKHPELEVSALEKVFDYWLAKRGKLVRMYRMNAGLVPLVPSKGRVGEKENAYVAFRHRGPRVTTRRKQKAETEHYGTILKLAASIRKVHLLTKAMVQRDRVKLQLAEVDVSQFEDELSVLDAGEKLVELDESSCNGQDGPLATKCSWLSRLWFDVVNDVLDLGKPLASTDLNAKAEALGATDGRFLFVRQPSCLYRSASKPKKDLGMHLSNEFGASPHGVDDADDLVLLSESEWERLTLSCSTSSARGRWGRSQRLNLDFFS